MSLLGSLGTVSNTVTSFQSLVNQAAETATSTINSLQNLSSSSQSAVNQLLTNTKIEFTKDLYNEAVSLAAALCVDLPFSQDTATHKYGLFNGKNIYKDFNGSIDLTTTNIKSCYGWLTIDNSSSEYVVFSNNDVSYIISNTDFTPQPIVKDFTPLYTKLVELNTSKDALIDDTKALSALATTYKNDVSQIIEQDQLTELVNNSSATNNYLNKDNPFTSDKTEDAPPTESQIELAQSPEKQVKAPKYTDAQVQQLHGATFIETNREIFLDNYALSKARALNKNTKSDIQYKDYESVQAIIYDLANGNSESYAQSVLYCYQQPDSISYTASASYDNPSPRGAQQPFAFYTGANAITLSFVLRYNYNELLKEGSNSEFKQADVTSLQAIADIAENFTRPWKKNNSVQPKLVKVVLPGISEIGYLTEASITYSGSMMGSYNSDSKGNDVKSSFSSYTENQGDNGSLLGHYINTDYFYDTLEVSCSLLVVKDIKLHPLDQLKNADVLAAHIHSIEKAEADSTTTNTENGTERAEQSTDNTEEPVSDPSKVVNTDTDINEYDFSNDESTKILTEAGFDFANDPDTAEISLEIWHSPEAIALAKVEIMVDMLPEDKYDTLSHDEKVALLEQHLETIDKLTPTQIQNRMAAYGMLL